jgi:hypothetical protein
MQYAFHRHLQCALDSSTFTATPVLHPWVPLQVVLLPEHSSGALLLGIDSAALTIHRWGPPVLPGPSGTAGSSPGGGRRLKLQLDGLQVSAYTCVCTYKYIQGLDSLVLGLRPSLVCCVC